MRTFWISVMAFLVFFVGTLSVIHVDRQGQIASGEYKKLIEKPRSML